MDFQALKQKAIEAKNKAIDFSTEKLADSSFTLSKKEDIDAFIQKSENKKFTNKETWETKTFTRKSILIFADEKTDFFKKALYILPVILTKGFSQNIPVKMVKVSGQEIKIDEYNLKEIPSLVVYENNALSKVVTGEENILKLVKKLELDINKLLEEF